MAVASDGKVFEAPPPSDTYIRPLSTTNVAALLGVLALHTHQTPLWDADMVAEMPEVLAELLDQASASPVGLSRRPTSER